MRMRRVALVFASAVALTAVAALFTGTVVLIDPYGRAVSASLIDGWGQRQALVRLGFAYVGFAYVGVPKIEGAIQIACANGKVIQGFYVTPGASTWYRLKRDGDC